jgi:hypothetical protein
MIALLLDAALPALADLLAVVAGKLTRQLGKQQLTVA